MLILKYQDKYRDIFKIENEIIIVVRQVRTLSIIIKSSSRRERETDGDDDDGWGLSTLQQLTTRSLYLN